MHCRPEYLERGGTRVGRLCGYLDSLDSETVLLSEWRNNVSGGRLCKLG